MKSTMFPQSHSHKYHFKAKGLYGTVELISKPSQIDQAAASLILVESFISEYEKYLSPKDIDKTLTSWRGEDKFSVKAYYENYFKEEYEDFNKSIPGSDKNIIDYWIQVSINNKLVGWATFLKEKDSKELYMNLLIVDPKFQKLGLGKELVFSLLKLGVVKELNAINLLLRKKIKAGENFILNLVLM